MKKSHKRTGLRIVARKGVSSDVREAILRFASWLRVHYEFPIRVPVYVSSMNYVKTIGGEERPSIFFAPSKKSVEPYISVAAGDYDVLVDEQGSKENALCSILYSVAYQVLQYQKWYFETGWSEATLNRKQEQMLSAYASEVTYIL